MRRLSLVLIAWAGLPLGIMPFYTGFVSNAIAQSADAKTDTPRITATEPVALTNGAKVTFKVRGFDLKDSTELRFPAVADAIVEIMETKDAGQPNGLDNNLVGNSQITAEVTLPPGTPAEPLEYVIATPTGDAHGQIRVLSADSVVDEKEPNDGFREAQEFRAGQYALGSIQSNKDVDVYAIHVQAGQAIKVAVTSGGPLLMDAELHCYDSRGQFLAAADDELSRDPVVTLNTKTDGVVFLCISSAHDVGGEWHSYLLTAEETK